MAPPTPRKACPSCGHRLSPLAVECPVCGLNLGGRTLVRPLLFQASAFTRKNSAPETPSASVAFSSGPLHGIVSPALGRVSPIPMHGPSESGHPSSSAGLALKLPASEALQLESEVTDSSFWALVKLEAGEAGILAVFNLVLALVICWQLHLPVSRCYSELWPFLLPLHAALSWAFMLTPMVLTGQSVLMVPLGLLLVAEQPERRLAFSLFHLLSVAAFPLSLFCMILTPNHRTLAELLTGQEILLKPLSRFS